MSMSGAGSKLRAELAKLSREELVGRATRHLSNDELLELACAAPGAKEGKKKERAPRPFDMDRYAQRHIALRVAYIGTNYYGLAWLADIPETVEGRLYDALLKTCLIKDRESCRLSRGGRTDKGVSALGQVVALQVRSNLKQGEGIVPPPAASRAGAESAASEVTSEAAASEKPEIDYVRTLNRVLPADIRVLAWRPVDASFSARFSAKQRTYKYFFQRADLDVTAMRQAAAMLVGEHDFRNFCKIDPAVASFTRRILSFDVGPVDGAPGDPSSPYAMWEFTVCGTAFLWHQVRCMVAVLFLVGQRKEPPSTVSELLDLAVYPARPNYEMASDAPLLLYDIGYDDVQWVHPASALGSIGAEWREEQRRHMLRAAMLHSMRQSLLHRPVLSPNAQPGPDAPGAEHADGAAPSCEAAASDASEGVKHLTPTDLCTLPPGGLHASPASGASGGVVPWGALAQSMLLTRDSGDERGPLPARRKGHVPLSKRPLASSVEERAPKARKKHEPGTRGQEEALGRGEDEG